MWAKSLRIAAQGQTALSRFAQLFPRTTHTHELSRRPQSGASHKSQTAVRVPRSQTAVRVPGVA